MAIQFFGAIDREGKKKTGSVRSEYPCWYHPARIDELQESVNRGERTIASGMVDNLPNSQEFKAELDRKRVLLDQILGDKPRLEGKDKDRVGRAYKELSGKIKGMMPSFSDMQKGLANPHDEVTKDSEPCVSVEGFVDIARECGVPLEKGANMVSRKQATRMWKIMGKSLGEVTNVEYLRRDESTGTYRQTRDLNQIIRDEG